MKNYGRKFKMWESCALIALSLSLMAGTWAQARQNAISSGIVRLHVLAVSDAEEEQKIKLEVRDEVLKYLEPVLKNASASDEARNIIKENLSGIASAADRAARGRKVSVSLGREAYPSREYEGFCLPAGTYESLKITLGEGRGHNWWCIVFPPLCLDGAQAEQVQSVMSRDDFKIISGGENYTIRFKITEIWGKITNLLPNY